MPTEVIPPEHKSPSEDWEHFELWTKINHVLKEIPSHFRSVISISGGINATEIYAFGSVLGVTALRVVRDQDGSFMGVWCMIRPRSILENTTTKF